MALTIERLKEVLHYDPLTGIFIWIVARKKIRVGDVAGCTNSDGYRQIGIDGKLYYAHRLAWLYEKGYFPEHGLDHRDRVPGHDWISNLREASQQCNLINIGNPKDNTSGIKGVRFNKRDKKWVARIVVNQKQFHLGSYKLFDNAVCARLAVEQCLGWSICNSSSPAYEYVKKNIQRK